MTLKIFSPKAFHFNLFPCFVTVSNSVLNSYFGLAAPFPYPPPPPLSVLFDQFVVIHWRKLRENPRFVLLFAVNQSQHNLIGREISDDLETTQNVFPLATKISEITHKQLTLYK